MNRRVQIHVALPGYAYDEIAINDLATAKFAGLALSCDPEVDATGHLANRVTIRIPEAEVDPSGGPGRGTNWLINLVQQLIHDGSTDPRLLPHPVVGRVLGGGREVFLHDLVTRIAQRAMKVVMEPHVERMLGPCVYSYRPGRSHLTALHHARCYLRRGYRWAAKADIAQYFPSISSTLMNTVGEGCGWLAEDAMMLILFFMSPLVLREPDHPAVVAGTHGQEEPAQHCVLQGSVEPSRFAAVLRVVAPS